MLHSAPKYQEPQDLYQGNLAPCPYYVAPAQYRASWADAPVDSRPAADVVSAPAQRVSIPQAQRVPVPQAQRVPVPQAQRVPVPQAQRVPAQQAQRVPLHPAQGGTPVDFSAARVTRNPYRLQSPYALTAQQSALKQALIHDLTAYCTRVSQDYNAGFKRCVFRQAINRKANHKLAQNLIRMLESVNTVNNIHRIFSRSNIKNIRQKRTCFNTVNSSELNKIIRRGRRL